MQSDPLSVLVFGRQMLGKNIVSYIFSSIVARVTRHIADKSILKALTV